jgi:phenylalanyl-tRNA synthetase beta chain
MTDEFVSALMPNTDGILALATPPAPNERFIRSSLLPNICKAIVKNERNFDEFDIFEEAQIFLDSNYTNEYKGEALPCQKKHLGCAFVGASDNISALFRRAKGVIGSMPCYTHMEGFTFEKIEKPYWADETVWLNICLNGKKIGDLALLSKKSALACGIKVLSAVLVELDMDELVPFKSRTNRFVRMPEFPMNDYDLSFLVDSMVKWDDIYDCVMSKKNELLRDVKFVDEYKGKQIPAGRKSVTIRLVIGSGEKTLTGDELDAVAASVVKRLSKTCGADVRTV